MEVIYRDKIWVKAIFHSDKHTVNNTQVRCVTYWSCSEIYTLQNGLERQYGIVAGRESHIISVSCGVSAPKMELMLCF